MRQNFQWDNNFGGTTVSVRQQFQWGISFSEWTVLVNLLIFKLIFLFIISGVFTLSRHCFTPRLREGHDFPGMLFILLNVQLFFSIPPPRPRKCVSIWLTKRPWMRMLVCVFGSLLHCCRFFFFVQWVVPVIFYAKLYMIMCEIIVTIWVFSFNSAWKAEKGWKN